MQIAQFYFILKYLAFNNNCVYRSKFINKMSRTKKIKIDWLIDKQSRFCHLWNCIHFVHYFPVFFYTYKTRGGNIQNYYLFLSRIYLFFFYNNYRRMLEILLLHAPLLSTCPMKIISLLYIIETHRDRIKFYLELARWYAHTRVYVSPEIIHFPRHYYLQISCCNNKKKRTLVYVYAIKT